MKVVILAGGLGTRLSEETRTIPKPMIEIGGKPMLYHIMKWYAKFGHKEFIICCGYKGDMIKKYFYDAVACSRDTTYDYGREMMTFLNGKTIMDDWKVTCVDTGEDTMTGGRIAKIAPLLHGEPFLLTYGDGVGNIDLNALHEQHMKTKAQITITAVEHPARFGVLSITDDGNVSDFAEKPQEHAYWINGGFAVVENKVIEGCEQWLDSVVWEKQVLPYIARHNKLFAYRHPGFWKCMDTLKDKMEFEEMYEMKGNIYGE
jgi:glucose-1-phosphate cytidylyltransferase